MPAGYKIPFTGLLRQHDNLREEILDTVDQVLRSGKFMDGVWTAVFEKWLADRNHCKHAVTTHSGTTALEIIAAYARQNFELYKPTVVIPAMTYVATANAFHRADWNIVFADVDNNGIIDIDSIWSKYYYDAVVAVGLYGADITHIGSRDFWHDFFLNNNILIEDAAQNWLASDCARIGNASAISFDPMKNFANIGNGGAVVTNDTDLYEFANSYRNNGKNSNYVIGSNVRMSEIDCATMMIKTKFIDRWQYRRKEIAAYWVERFSKTPARCLVNNENLHNHACHKFVLDIDFRDQFRECLNNDGIETRIHYENPIHELPVYQKCANPGILSLASALSRRVVSLPIYPELTDEEVEFIADRAEIHLSKLHS